MLKVKPCGSGPIRRFGAVLAATAAGAVLVAGCATGQDVQTVGQRPPIDGASASAGNIEVRAAGVLSPDSGASYIKGGTALLQLVLINTGASDDTLTSVSTPAASSALVSDAGLPATVAAATSSAASSASASASSSNSASTPPTNEPIKLPAGQSIQVGFSVVGPNISLNGLTAALYPAQTVPITFGFASGASVSIDMSVKLAGQAPSAPVISEATQPAE
ncbi:MAG: hypothetical protein ABI140_10520 [Jatrophihabitantaceae bacterium]